ncbi:MAG TPA: hypothetical protein VL689_10600 [Paraburkholderia sp.]|nr:hypothetical protein [Paraburkholderia sp.]
MTFVDQEIAHIKQAIALSLQKPAQSGLPVFPAAYWRNRLRQLMDRHHLEHSQLCAVDALLLQLDRIEARRRWLLPANTAA